MNKKRGNVIITLSIIIAAFVLFAFFIQYYQINVMVRNMRNDIFYACNNGIIAMDIKELSYFEYDFNENMAKDKIEELLKKNHIKEESTIKEIKIEKIEYTKANNNMMIKLKITFKPVIKIGDKPLYSFYMTESTKISLLEYY